MNIHSTLLSISKHAAAFAVTMSLLASASAQIVWDGNGNNANSAWGTANNWVGDASPGTGDTVRFGNGTATAGFVPTAILLGGDRTIQNLEIVPNIVAFSIDNNLIGTNTLTLNGGGITNNNGNSDVFFNNNFTLAANGTFIRGRAQTSNRITNFRGSIGESGGARSMTFDFSSGTGATNHTINLQAVNTYSGGTFLKGNDLKVFLNAVGTLGAGAVTFDNTSGVTNNLIFQNTIANTSMSKPVANNLEIGGAGSKILELRPVVTSSLKADQTVDLSGVISSATNLTNSLNFRIAGTGVTPSGTGLDSILTMRISGNNTFTTSGSGAVFLRTVNANSFTNAPRFLLAHNNALGVAGNTVGFGSGGNIDAGKATLLIDGAHTIAQSMTIFSASTSPESKTIGGTGAFSSIFSGNMEFSTNGAGNIVNFTQETAGGRVTFSGNISGNANTATKIVGAGEVVFSGANNTYSGGTIIAAGTLLVNSATNSGLGIGNVTVQSGGTLGGGGRIAPTGTSALTVQNNGILAPGNGGTAIGNLTINLGATTGNLTMATGAQFKFDLGTVGVSFAAPGTSDRLSITGAAVGDVAFNSTAIDFGGSATGVGFYKLFSTDLASGTTWSGLTLAGQQITGGLLATNLGGSYSGSLFLGDGSSFGDRDSIYIQVIPEPGTNLLVGAAAFAFLLIRRLWAAKSVA